jgi:hypothetical protein
LVVDEGSGSNTGTIVSNQSSVHAFNIITVETSPRLIHENGIFTLLQRILVNGGT